LAHRKTDTKATQCKSNIAKWIQNATATSKTGQQPNKRTEKLRK